MFSPLNTLQGANENTTYAQTFPDTAVLVKQMPARAKKHKGDLELGVTPLAHVNSVTNASTSQTSRSHSRGLHKQ